MVNVTRHICQLESIGFAEETLDRAIALAGADRLAYQMLHQAVTLRGLSPAEALHVLEADRSANI